MFQGKKLFILGFIIILLIGIPLTVYFVQKQQETRSRAETATTTLSFSPATSVNSPKQATVGDTIPLDITIDPGSNKVQTVKLVVQYDSNKLELADTNAFAANTAVFPTITEGPLTQPGQLTVTLSVGSDPAKALTTAAKVGTVTLKAKTATDTSPTSIFFSTETQATAVGGSSSTPQNVLASSSPAFIAIANNTSAPLLTTVPSPSLSPTQQPVADLPTPTVTAVTPSPTPTVAIAVATPTPALIAAADTPTTLPSDTPTMAPTGPGDTILGIGAIAGFITLVGAVLLFAL